MYVYKEVWVHPSARWLLLMADLLPAATSLTGTAVRADSTLVVSAVPGQGGRVVVRLTLSPTLRVGRVTLRADGLVVDRPTRVVPAGRAGAARVVEWTVRETEPNVTWVAVAVLDGDVWRRREVVGGVR
jgi:hypothetical protein